MEFVSLSAQGTELLVRYSSLLQSLGTRLGLTHLTETQVQEQIERSLAMGHLLVSRMERWGKADRSLIDVGSGAGLPAIPLVIVFLDQLGPMAPHIFLVEPKRKAVAFLEKTLRDLGLAAQVIGEPVETVAKNSGLRGDFVTAKALARPQRALDLCAPVCKIGGHIVLAGRSDTAGLSEALPADVLSALGLSPPQTEVVGGPNATSQAIHIIQKVRESSS